MHLLWLTIILGWGASIPFGPINLEIVRRNLTVNTSYGMIFGIGACFTDLTYLILLCLGFVSFLEQPTVLRVIGFIGAIILVWFAFRAFIATASNGKATATPHSFWRNAIAGYMMTLVNPFTVLFWASVSAQITLVASDTPHALWFASIGVLIGTVSWVIGLNILLHFTRHRLGERTMQVLNYLGGLILLGFAGYSIWHSLVLN